MTIYPAIDLSQGQCVRLHRGDLAAKTVYDDYPVNRARLWVACGGRFLHVVDLDGSFEGRPANLELVAQICRHAGVPVQVGGGIRGMDTIEQYFAAGAARVVLGTAAVRDPKLTKLALTRHGERVVIDVAARDGKVAVQGWSEATDLDAVEFAQRVQDLGAKRIVFTDVHTDGALQGPNLPALRRMAGALDLEVIASGGVTTLADVSAVAELEPLGVTGLIIGRALYEGTVALIPAIHVAGQQPSLGRL